MAKATKVRLTPKNDPNLTRAFDVEHAEAMFRDYGERCAWRVADDEPLEWTEDGFRPKSNNRGNKKAK
jgi:hypothetical protein